MKMHFRFLILVCLVALNCKKEKNHLVFLKARLVGIRDLNCKLPILDFSADSMSIRQITHVNTNTFIALNLPARDSIPNTELNVAVAVPDSRELVACITFGPNYPEIEIVALE
ncbi:hypothetical protein ACX0G9_07850 [Flavitalea flava]